MRPIKFRAWRKDARIMFPVLGINFGEWGFVDVEQQLPPLSLNEIELMQFTGLLDKNGKEIYEGDILAYAQGQYADKSIRGDVRFQEGDFIIYFGKKSPAREPFISIRNCMVYEIVGNIHEHPDLLK